MRIARMFDALFKRQSPPARTPVAKDADWSSPLTVLRQKWTEVPTTRSTRRRTGDLLLLSDDELRREWEAARTDITTGDEFAHRGWYHCLYADTVVGKKILDVGSGFAVDSVTFAQLGADVTFVDLAEENLEVVKRLCRIFRIRDAHFMLLERIESLRNLPHEYDIVMALGSLHHAPAHVIKPEVDELRRHLKPGGRWLQLAYPESRWRRSGCPPFSTWGEMTDGLSTPWTEWYDINKLLRLHAPGHFDTVLNFEFHNNDFCWFDLAYRGELHGVDQ